MIQLQRVNIANLQAPDEVMDEIGMSLMQPTVRVIPAIRKYDGQKVWILGNPVPPEFRDNIENESETRIFAMFLSEDMMQEYEFPGSQTEETEAVGGEDNG